MAKGTQTMSLYVSHYHLKKYLCVVPLTKGLWRWVLFLAWINWSTNSRDVGDLRPPCRRHIAHATVLKCVMITHGAVNDAKLVFDTTRFSPKLNAMECFCKGVVDLLFQQSYFGLWVAHLFINHSVLNHCLILSRFSGKLFDARFVEIVIILHQAIDCKVCVSFEVGTWYLLVW